MESILKQLNDAKVYQAQSKDWASMLGADFSGGGGGVGHLKYLFLDKKEGRAPTLYFQPYNGANNYHSMPDALIPFLERAITCKFGELLANALLLQEQNTQSLAAAALKEHAALMKAAGISV